MVEVADSEWFGLDGTQPPPPPPVEPDPLAGLVTGIFFAEPVVTPETTANPAENPTAATPQTARRLYARPARPAERPQARPLQPASSPDAIPVAAPLSARSGVQKSKPPATTASRIGTQPGRVAPAAPARVAPVNWQPPRSAPTRATPRRPAPVPARRRADAGCSFFLLIIVILVIAFVVLGIVLGHGSGGTGVGG